MAPVRREEKGPRKRIVFRNAMRQYPICLVNYVVGARGLRLRRVLCASLSLGVDLDLL
jgi:hypothetical protein